MPRTIVVPLVGPEQDPKGISENPLPLASRIAEQVGADVLLVSIIETPQPVVLSPENLTREHRAVIARRETYLKQVARRFPNTTVRISVKVGDPAFEIRRATETLDKPMIAMASHARTGVNRLLLGSVAFSVIHETSCPVLLVREPAPASSIQDVLVPLDGSPFAENGLETALDLLDSSHSHLRLLHVIEPSPIYVGLGGSEYQQAAQLWATEYLHRSASRLAKRGFLVSHEIRGGDVANEIISISKERSVDLIAMATHGRSGVSRLLFGSVAERVLHEASVPVLLTRLEEHAVFEGDQPREIERPVCVGAAPAPATAHRVTAADIMSHPTIAVSAHATIQEIARTMLAHRIGCVPVVDDHGNLAGIITESDFTRAGGLIPLIAYLQTPVSGENSSATAIDSDIGVDRIRTADSIMIRLVVTAEEDAPVAMVVERMIKNNIRHIPIMRQGQLVGVVSRRDLLKLAIAEDLQQPHG